MPRAHFYSLNTKTIHATDAAPAADLSPLLDRLHAMHALTLARMLPDASIDMVNTDTPYSSGGLHTS
ncbi:site-specific DNA-methyltransferase, partial [Burkholderia pseudomallei]